jgi:hypothetical protein
MSNVNKPYKHLYTRTVSTLVLGLSFCFHVNATNYAERSTATQAPPSMSEYGRKSGAGNGVNLFTGDAEFTVPLGSISAGNGISYTVNALYSSNVAMYGAEGGFMHNYFYSPTGETYTSGDNDPLDSDDDISTPFLYRGYEYDWQSKLYNFNGVLYNPEDVLPYAPLSNGSFLSPYVVFGGDPINN